MSKRVEFIGGPWDGERRVIHEGSGIRLLGHPIPLPFNLREEVPDRTAKPLFIGEYRSLPYYGDGHFWKWYPDLSEPSGTEKPR